MSFFGRSFKFVTKLKQGVRVGLHALQYLYKNDEKVDVKPHDSFQSRFETQHHLLNHFWTIQPTKMQRLKLFNDKLSEIYLQ